MARIVTLGEILLRLSPPGHQRFLQAEDFEVHFGGCEANAAVSLAMMGHECIFLSKVPEHFIGECAIQALQKHGIDCSGILRGGNRLGIYFLENGASVRGSNVIYDRSGSAISECAAGEFDFTKFMKGADLFHVSGITAVLSETAGKLVLEAVKKAKEYGVCVSFDLNYRTQLWKNQIREKQELLSKIMEYTDICFGNPLDLSRCLGYLNHVVDFEAMDYEECISSEAMAAAVKNYGLKYLVSGVRGSISASDNSWSAVVSDGGRFYSGSEYHLHIVDRVGGGDAFAAGFLHGFLTGKSMADTLEFAIAAGAVKHTILGDFNYAAEKEIEELMKNKGQGRVIR